MKMNAFTLGIAAATLVTAGAVAQTAPSTTGHSRSGPAAASGDNNQAVATTAANAPGPAKGANSFTESQAQSRLRDQGFSDVSALEKDQDGVWRGKATKGS